MRCRGCDSDTYADGNGKYCRACNARYSLHGDRDVRAAYWHTKLEQAKKDALEARRRLDWNRCEQLVGLIELIHPELGSRMRESYLHRGYPGVF